MRLMTIRQSDGGRIVYDGTDSGIVKRDWAVDDDPGKSG
jgi:hypothetical protein